MLDSCKNKVFSRNRGREPSMTSEAPKYHSNAVPFHSKESMSKHIYSTPTKRQIGSRQQQEGTSGMSENVPPFVSRRCSFSSAFVPSKSAGVKEMVMCTPQKEDNRPEVQYARLLVCYSDAETSAKRIDIAQSIVTLAKEKQKFNIALVMLRCILHQSPYRLSAWIDQIKQLEDLGHFESAMHASIHSISFCGTDDALLMKAMKLSERQSRLDLARHVLFVSKNTMPQKQQFFLLEGAKLEARVGNHHVVKTIYNYILQNIASLSTCGGNAFIDAALYEIGKLNLSSSISVILRGMDHCPRHAPLFMLLHEVQLMLSQLKQKTMERAMFSEEQLDDIPPNSIYFEKEKHLQIGSTLHVEIHSDGQILPLIQKMSSKHNLAYFQMTDCSKTIDACETMGVAHSDMREVLQGSTTWQYNLAQHQQQCEYLKYIHQLSPKFSSLCDAAVIDSTALLCINGCTCGSMREYLHTKTTHANLDEVRALGHAEFCYVTIKLKSNHFFAQFYKLTSSVAPIVPPLAFQKNNNKIHQQPLPRELLELEMFCLIPKLSQYLYLPDHVITQENEYLTQSIMQGLHSYHNTEQQWRLHLLVLDHATRSLNLDMMNTASQHALKYCTATLQWKVHLTTSKRKLEQTLGIFRRSLMNAVSLLQKEMAYRLTGTVELDVLAGLSHAPVDTILQYLQNKLHTESFITISSELLKLMPLFFQLVEEAESSSQAACVCVSKRNRSQVALVHAKTKLFGDYFRSIQSGICVYFENIRICKNIHPIYTYQQAFATAKQSLEQLTILNPGEWRVRVELSYIYIQQGEYSRAMGVLQDSLVDCPTNGRILANLISFHRNSSKDDILRVLQHAIKDSPKSGEIWCEGARQFLDPSNDMFDINIAATMLRFAIHFTPQYGDSFIELLKCKLLRHDIGCDLLDLSYLKQLCVNSEPNYGTMWLECKYLTLSKTAGETFDMSRLLIFEEIVRNKQVYQLAMLRSINSQHNNSNAIDAMELNKLLHSPEVTRASLLTSSSRKKDTSRPRIDRTLTEEIKKELLVEMDSVDAEDVGVKQYDNEEEEQHDLDLKFDIMSPGKATGTGLFPQQYEENEDWDNRPMMPIDMRTNADTLLGERFNVFRLGGLSRLLLPAFDVDLLFPRSKRTHVPTYKDVDLFLNTLSNFAVISSHLWKHSFDLDDGLLH